MAASMSGSFMNFQKSVYGGGGFEKKKSSVFTINKMCASCSGQNQHIIKLFKLACIYYQSSKVPFLGCELDRDLVADIQSSLCNQIQAMMLQNGDYGMSKLMMEKQREVAQFVEDQVLQHANEARNILSSEENKITSQPFKFLGQLGVAPEAMAKAASGSYEKRKRHAKGDKAGSQSMSEDIVLAAFKKGEAQQRNTRVSTDELHVQVP